MRTYLKRLRGHPGLPIASVMTVAAFFIGADRGLSFALFSAGLMGAVCWLPVLITARTQPLDGE